MNTKNHKPNKGSFKAGQVDSRRNTKGQVKKETVALGALLKEYLTLEGLKPHSGWPFNNSGEKGNKAQALAARIWEEALNGKFQFVQFVADRILGKVKDEIAIESDGASLFPGELSMAALRKSAKQYDKENGII